MGSNHELSWHSHCQDKALSQQFQLHSDVDESQNRFVEASYQPRSELANYLALYDNLPLPCFMLDGAGYILAINPLGASQLGYSSQELVNQSMFDLVHPEDQELLQSEFATWVRCLTYQIAADAPFATPAPNVVHRFRYLCRDGSLRWMKGTARMLSERQALQILFCWEDITESQSLKMQLQQQVVNKTFADSEAKWHSLIQNSSDIITVLAVDGTIHYESTSVTKLLGYRPEELVGRNVFELVHPDDLAEVLPAFNCVSQNPSVSLSVELRFRRKDGSWCFLESTGRNLLNDPSIAGIVVNSRDIRERKWAQETLRKTYAELEERNTELAKANRELHSALGWLVHDMGERKQTEAALRESESQLRLALEAAHKQTQRERLVGAIAQRIRQSLNLEEILNTTVAEVRQFLQADRVLIYRLWPDGSGSAVTEAVVPDCQALLGQTFPEEAFPRNCQQLYSQGRVRAIADIEESAIAPCMVEFMRQFGVKAKLVASILQGDALWGLLVVHQCQQPRQWQPVEVDLLRQLTLQVGIAIQQSELYQQVRQLNADLECQIQSHTLQLRQALNFESTLKKITDKVRDSLDEDQILQMAVQGLAVGLGVDCCDAALYDTAHTVSVIHYEWITNNSLPNAQGSMLPMEDYPEIYQQLLQGQHFQFCELLPNLLRPVHNQFAVMACPMFDDQGALGDLWLFKPKHEVFDELEVRLIQQVANQCAIALRQARLYQAAQAQVEELEKLNRLKDEFLSTVSHELRSPVCNMKMAIQMLEMILHRETEEQAKLAQSRQLQAPETQQDNSSDAGKSPFWGKMDRYVQILHNECKREIDLINDLLDLQRLEAGVRPLSMGAIQLQLWLPSVVKPFQERARQRQQRLQVELPSHLPSLLSDVTSLERVLAELLNNACKYTPPGEAIVVTATALAMTVRLSVRNFGTEIPHSELSRIFDKFYRVPNADPWKQGGTGLGLALVKKLIEHLGGSITVESEAGQTCFMVELPRSGVGGG